MAQLKPTPLNAAMPAQGFTLVELIIVISLMGTMVAIVGVFMSRPFQAYEDQANRSNLVTIVTSALVNMKRDVNQAVPNSLRVNTSGSVSTLEFMSITSGGRYRYSASADDEALSPSMADAQFHSLGNISAPSTATDAINRLVVNPLDTNRLYEAAADTDADTDPEGIITPMDVNPDSTAISITHTPDAATTNPEDDLLLDNTYQFDPIGNGSFRKRFYITDSPMMYRCDTGTGELRRYRYYTPAATGSTTAPSDATPTTGNLVINNLSFCSIKYDPGTATRSGVVTITLGVSINNEEVRMVQQLQVSNAP